MKIVIEIPEQRYKWIVENPLVYTTELDEAVRKGTPLPEYHGRLIDADKVESMLKNHAKSESEAWALVELLNVLDEIPTVLKATKEGDGE